jgi:hypothetical protein
VEGGNVENWASNWAVIRIKLQNFL